MMWNALKKLIKKDLQLKNYVFFYGKKNIAGLINPDLKALLAFTKLLH